MNEAYQKANERGMPQSIYVTNEACHKYERAMLHVQLRISIVFGVSIYS